MTDKKAAASSLLEGRLKLAVMRTQRAALMDREETLTAIIHDIQEGKTQAGPTGITLQEARADLAKIAAMKIDLEENLAIAEREEGTNPLAPAIFTEAKVEEDGLVKIGTGELPKDLIKTLSAGENIDALDTELGGRPIANRNIAIDVLRDQDNPQLPARAIIYTHKHTDTTITIELPDITAFKGSNKATKKVLNFVLLKANSQALDKARTLIREDITFNFRELVDAGMYTTIRAARRGVEAALDELGTIRIRGVKKITENKIKETYKKTRVLFKGYDTSNNECTVFLNDIINWSLVIPYYALFPSYYFELSNKAADLLYYVFYLARQNAEEIANKGRFTISLRAIQDALQLPDEKTTLRHDQQIKKPLEAAIEEIMTTQNLRFNNTNLELTLDCIKDAKITEYLNRGKLVVAFKGGFKKAYSELAAVQASRIKARKTRQERVEDQAKAIAKAKKIIALEEY